MDNMSFYDGCSITNTTLEPHHTFDGSLYWGGTIQIQTPQHPSPIIDDFIAYDKWGLNISFNLGYPQKIALQFREHIKNEIRKTLTKEG